MSREDYESLEELNLDDDTEIEIHSLSEEELARYVEDKISYFDEIEEDTTREMSVSEKAYLIKLLEERQLREDHSGHLRWFPNEGPLRAEKYPKHLKFFEAGKIHRERIFMAANRVGKTLSGAYELTCHLTGIYPEWWKGRVFNTPTDCWAAGDTGQTTRDIIQKELLGPPGKLGTGMIPKDCILAVRNRAGIVDAIDSVQVKHISGGTSYLGFKSFDQKRRSFQGTAKHAIWLDEEPPADVYDESRIRTMTTRGLVYVTFTPLQGLTKFVSDFMKNAEVPEGAGAV